MKNDSSSTPSKTTRGKEDGGVGNAFPERQHRQRNLRKRYRRYPSSSIEMKLFGHAVLQKTPNTKRMMRIKRK